MDRSSDRRAEVVEASEPDRCEEDLRIDGVARYVGETNFERSVRSYPNTVNFPRRFRGYPMKNYGTPAVGLIPHPDFTTETGDDLLLGKCGWR